MPTAPIPAIDLSQPLATLLAGDLDTLDTPVSGANIPLPSQYGNQSMGLMQALIAAQPASPTGSACSLLGRSANSTGQRADIAASTNDRVLARSGNALSFMQITDAMVANATARSVKGRAANSAGAQADIAGGGNRTVLSDNGTTLAFRSIDTLLGNLSGSAAGGVVFEEDWSALATTAKFADGAVVIGSRTWTSVLGSASTLWQLTNGTGLQWTPAAGGAGTRTWTATTANLGTETASWLRISLADLLAGAYDPAARYAFEIRYSGYTTGNANRLYFGLYRPQNVPTGAAVNCRLASLYVATGPHPAAGVLPNGTITGNDNITLAASGTLGLVVEPIGSAMVHYGGTWPALPDGVFAYPTSISDVPLQRSDSYLVISSSMSVAAVPTAAWNISAIRVRRL
jgi:hypothetical protein